MKKCVEKLFGSVLKNRRGEIVAWIRCKFSKFCLGECEDIAQESSLDLWSWLEDKDGLDEKALVALWKKMSWYRCTHLLRKGDKFQMSSLDENFKDVSDEGLKESQERKNALWRWIEGLRDADRKLIEMYLDHRSMTEISNTLGFSGPDVAKNRKCRLVRRMKAEVPQLMYSFNLIPCAA